MRVNRCSVLGPDVSQMPAPGIMRPHFQFPTGVVPKYRHKCGSIVGVPVHTARVVHVEGESGVGDRSRR
eukprot:12806942-Prorocentrum_lima.AAC.1